MQVEIERLDRTRAEDRRMFAQFPERFYGKDRWAAFHLAKADGMVQAPGDFEIYAARGKGGHLVGRMAVGRNEALRDEEGRPYGYVGLFEVEEDYACFRRMLEAAGDLLRETGVRSVLFPFFISTHYPYRFTSEGRDAFRFFLEHPDQPHYAAFARRCGLEVVYPADSYLDRDIDRIMRKNERQHLRTREFGFTVRSIDPTNIDSELRILHALSTAAFSQNPYYTGISYERFSSYYRETLKLVDPAFLRITFNDREEPVGFSFSTPDLIRTPPRGIILKSVAVLPECRQQGVLGTWTYLDCQLASKRGYEYVIGAYVPRGNISKKVLTSDTLTKEHELYRIRL